ncbi:MAG TPA: hypothetical protein VF153_04150 [Candidatus Limnocylindria bacterium]
MTVALVGRDLLFGSRVADLVARSGRQFLRVDDPSMLPAAKTLSVVLVDWTERAPDWEKGLRDWYSASDGAQPRLILFGSHKDLTAHAAARSLGHGPMWGRSKVLADLPKVLDG